MSCAIATNSNKVLTESIIRRYKISIGLSSDKII